VSPIADSEKQATLTLVPGPAYSRRVCSVPTQRVAYPVSRSSTNLRLPPRMKALYMRCGEPRMGRAEPHLGWLLDRHRVRSTLG
jgi:hypothetical protein